MYAGQFETLFRQISSLFTLKIIAEKKTLSGNFPKKNPETTIWDSLDDAYDQEFIDIGGGEYVSCSRFLRKPTRILFFLLLTEFENRLFRIHEWLGRDVSELNEKHLNDFIRDLSESDLMKLQNEYPARAEFHNDMKALSSFRNVIMHVNKKLEREVELETLIKRKKQAIRVLASLQEILDKMKH